jgi:thiamine pyrophosphate-dependent acetolactate synthase large subunit-like protein
MGGTIAYSRPDCIHFAEMTITTPSAAPPRNARLTGGAALARVLSSLGVLDLFGVPAGKLGPFLRAAGEDGSGFRHVAVRHEASAAWMATAIFHGTGELAVAYGESGPGSHNLVSALGSARANGLAVLVVTSGAPTHAAYPHEGLVMDVDNTELFAGATKWRAVVRDPARVPALVHRAVRAALTGRPGPVHLEIAADVLAAEADYDLALLDAPLAHVVASGRPQADPSTVEQAAELLLTARRPLIISGGGVTLSDASEELRAVRDALGAAATATQMGLGTIGTDDPGFFGHGGVIGGDAVLRALAEADAVLAVGCRFSGWLWDGAAPAVRGWPDQVLVQVDVEAERIGQARPVSVGLLGDARAVLAQLRDAIGSRAPSSDAAWVAGLVEQRSSDRAAMLRVAAEASTAEAMHPAALADALGRALPADALVMYDGAHTSFFSNDFTPATAPRTRFHEPGMGHLGFGLPYALALKARFPARPVVNITGDGAFGFTVADLDTARRHGFAAVHVIHDNAAWGVIELGQRKAGFSFDTALEGTDYVAIATAFGCHAERITSVDEVAPALERALTSGLPAVIDARTLLVPHPGLPRFGASGRRQPPTGAP